MSPHVDPELNSIRESPERGDSIVILIGVSGEKEPVINEVQRQGGELLDSLPYGGLRVDVPEPAVNELCATSGIRSIEARHQVTTQ